MLIIKMCPTEADAAFPYNMGTEKPTGEVEMDLINAIWHQLDANSGPYPEVAQWKDWVVLDCFNEAIFKDKHGDEVFNVAAATVEFVDGTTIAVQFQCYC